MVTPLYESVSSNPWYRKVYGGWLGKSIGGTLGMPSEGEMRVLAVDAYDATISLPAPNDDLDLQLVNLHALEQYGPRLLATHLGREWLEHVFFPFDEYGYAIANLRRGLALPLAGWFNNPFIDCMGAPIRSELWAMLAPGRPEIAAYYAWQDALVDHAGGEGMYGEIFFAAIESLAFVESDRDRLIAAGLEHIPERCRVAQAVRHAIDCYRKGHTWQETRASVLTDFGHKNFTDAPQNVAFTIIGWLYGKDFGDAVLTAINCGYDTDCTGATLGSILGIIVGAENIPAQWSKPVGNQVVVSAPIRYLDAPHTLEELTERTLHVAQETQALWENPRIAERLLTRFRAEINTFSPWVIQPQQANDGPLLDDTISISVAFQDQHPAIGRGQTKTLLVTLTNRLDSPWQGVLELKVPEGWSGTEKLEVALAPLTTRTYVQEITANEVVRPAYEALLQLTREQYGTLWNTLSFPIALLPATHWEIVAPERGLHESCIFSGNHLTLPAQFQDYRGEIRARTTLDNPTERTLRLTVVAPVALEVRLDGERLFVTQPIEAALPTFHRPEPGSFGEFFMHAGQHELELVFTHDVPMEEISVLPVAASAVKEPGPYYYLTDILFLPPSR